MQRYDSYKPSGVQWLGEIPGHWEMISTKYIAKLYTGNSLNDASKEKYSLFSDDSYPYIASKDISLGTGTVDYDNGLYIPKDESFFEIAPKNSFLLCIEGGSAGRKKAFLDRNCCFVNKLCCFDSALNPKYHYYFIQGDYFRTMFNCSLQGMIGGVSVSALKNIYTIVPPLEEQTAIANYLDSATAKIDAAIAQQQKMIDLLNERKQIIINRAVTKGLNPNAKMKDSGVEWIGEVPEEWCFVRLKHLTKIISKGTTPSTIGKEILPNGNIRFLKAENIVNNSVCENPEFFIDEATHAILKRSNLQENDLLFVIAGATIGKVAILPKELTPANTNQAISFIRLNNPEMAKYIWYVLQSEITKKYIWLNAVQSAQPNISMEDLGNIQMPIPDVSIQKEIINSIEAKVSPIENSICNCQKQISLLQERKQIIINEVVTGKVKVSN